MEFDPSHHPTLSVLTNYSPLDILVSAHYSEQMTAIALQYREQILAQVAQGAMLTTVAKSLGIAAPNISKHLALDPEYQQAREIGAELRLHLAYERMNECAEGEIVENEETGEKALVESKGNLARAREACWRAATWFAEREFPHRWGQTNKLQVEQIGDRADSLRAAKARLIEGEVIVDSSVQTVDK